MTKVAIERIALMRMASALRDAAETFEYYARSHADKKTPEGDAKAARNLDMASVMRKALDHDDVRTL